MTDFMTRLPQMLSTPWVPWIILGVIVVGVLLGQVQKHVPDDPIARIKKTFGAEDMPHGVALAIVLLWAALGAVLAAGLLTLLAEIAWSTVRPETPTGESDFRFLLTKATALTAVLGGLIALPFTALRLKHTATQTRHAANVLFNEKLNDANTDLHARYQTTEKQEDGTYVDIWKDDIIRRNGAIDRLEALAIERPVMAPRIARMLCVYLKEMSQIFPAKHGAVIVDEPIKFEKVDHKLQRKDMEFAVQVLGKLSDKAGILPAELAIDLSGTNLQGMDLSGLDFTLANLKRTSFEGATLTDTVFERAHLVSANLSHTDLLRTNIKGANLSGAILNATWLQETKIDEHTILSVANARQVILRRVDLSKNNSVEKLLASAYGDGSVKLPEGIEKPEWPNEEKDGWYFFQIYDKHIRPQYVKLPSRSKLPPE
jgi:hypothetical protein